MTSDRLDAIGKQILALSRNELYLRMRFLDVALSSFAYVMDGTVSLVGTDGWNLYFNPAELGGLFRKDRISVNRAYLHLVLHCIFRHMITRGSREELWWNMACDIVAESVIDEWQVRSIRRGQSWLRQETYRKLRSQMKVLTAEKVYRQLLSWELSQRDTDRLVAEFTVDDHRDWAKDEDQDRKLALNQKWKDVSDKMQTDMETFSQEASSSSGHFLRQIQVDNRERCDYREFLRKFAVLKEEMAVDEDSFDYVFYSYGLRLYGNMPLVEPQEWKEVKKVEDFVIVIDTSMSCSGELVKRFLEETYGILQESGSFFRKVNIHILQCDDQVQSDQKITCKEELKEYMEHLDLAGEGGTDFRPAFAYIDQMMEGQEFDRLKGVLYFTDGQGIYPQKMPPYETAFVFIQKDYEEAQVPSWAMKLMIEEDEIEAGGKQDEY
ncbi:VWA-like domain-containing protein [Roseburia hominis]